MDPICMFAIFADDVRQNSDGVDLLNVHNQITMVTLPAPTRDQTGVVMHRVLLHVAMFADEGFHTLSFSHQGEEYAPSSNFAISESNFFLLQVERDFPINFAQDDLINVFPLLLDGAPLANAYIRSHLL